MPASQPVRSRIADPLAIDVRLQERFELLNKKYSAGLEPHEVRRLAEIEEQLDRQDYAKADETATTPSHERMARIDAALDRIEGAIRDLKASPVN